MAIEAKLKNTTIALARPGDRKTITLARLIAKQEVVNEIKRRGDKLRNYSAKQLTLMAEDYIDKHRAEVTHEFEPRAGNLRSIRCTAQSFEPYGR